MIIEPKSIDDLSPEERKAIMERSMEDISSVHEHVRKIVGNVKIKGDEELLASNREYKASVHERDLEVTQEEIRIAYDRVQPQIIESLKAAAKNIKRFHQAQLEKEMWSLEVSEGILAGRLTRPIETVGCYVPGGKALYPSTTLMTIIPARAAGVDTIIVTTPPGKDMVVPPVTLVAADIAGCDRIFKVGGPWGIAAMAYGTKTVPKVDKIVGPGNIYVTAAKMIVYGEVDIDSPAGPSEVLILADDSADPEWVAIDFLSQAEHDPDSAAVLVATSSDFAQKVCELIDQKIESLPRKAILDSSLSKHSYALVAKDMDAAISFTNDYAAEHLQIMSRDPFIILNRIRHAGSIFLGPYAPVPVGDYASGTNHVLPTGQCARMFSGLSVDDFIKKSTFQYLSKQGLSTIKDTVVNLAESEGLPIHAMAVKARFE